MYFGSDLTLHSQLRQYQVVGRRRPTEREIEEERLPQIFRMRIFAPNAVVAKSRFWYFMHQMSSDDPNVQLKLKRSTGEVLAVNEVRDSSKSAALFFYVCIFNDKILLFPLFSLLLALRFAGRLSCSEAFFQCLND